MDMLFICIHVERVSEIYVFTLKLSDVAPPPLVRNIHLRQSEDSLRRSTQARRKFVCDNESAQVVFTHLSMTISLLPPLVLIVISICLLNIGSTIPNKFYLLHSLGVTFLLCLHHEHCM